MSNLKAFMRVSSNAQVGFTDSSKHDLLFFTSSNSQRILMGTKQNQAASFAITSNSVIINENLGVGTSSPVNRFTIKSSHSDANSGFCLDASDGTTYNLRQYAFIQGGAQVGYKFDVLNNGATNTALTLGYNGNVGIGTSTAHRLDVAGTIRAGATGTNTSLLLGDSTDTTPWGRFISALDSTIADAGARSITFGKANTQNNQAELTYAHTANGSANNRLSLGFHSAGVMHLLANGNVGIGTITPTARLDLDVTFYQHPPSANASGYTATASSSYSGTTPSSAIDDTWSTYWLTADVDAGSTVTNIGTFNNWWWQLSLPASRIITGLRLATANHGINRFLLVASTNGTSWTVLLNRNDAGTIAISADTLTTFTFTNSTSYIHYRIIITELPVNPYGKPLLREVRMLEASPNNRALRIGNTSGGDGLLVDWDGKIISPLHVVGSGGIVNISTPNATSSSYIEFNTSNMNNMRFLIGANGTGFSGASGQGAIATWTNHPITFFTNALERMRIDSSGNVGIGTSNPKSVLHVAGTGGLCVTGTLNGGGYIGSNGVYLGDYGNDRPAIELVGSTETFLDFTTSNQDFAGRIRYNHGNNSMFFHTNANTTPRLTLNNAGNVGIGTSSPAHRLDVVGGNARIYRSDDHCQLIVDAMNNQWSNRIAGITLLSDSGDGHAKTAHIQAAQDNSGQAHFDTKLDFRTRSGWDGPAGWLTTQVQASLRSSGNLQLRGQLQASGFDYAELFEWDDGNITNEDRIGHSVILTVDGKIRIALDTDNASEIFGVVSATYSILGNSKWAEWQGKYLYDDFGRIVLEEIDVVSWKDETDTVMLYRSNEVPPNIVIPENAKYEKHQVKKLNPAWDSNIPYVPRDERKEWSAIGFLGRLRIRNSSPRNSSWIKIRDVSETVSEYLIT